MNNQYKDNLLYKSITKMPEFKKIEIHQADVLYQSIAIHLKTTTGKSILRWAIFEKDIQFEPTTFYIENLEYLNLTTSKMPNWRMGLSVWTEVDKKYYQGKLIDPNERRPNGLKKIYKKDEITIVKEWEYVRKTYHILVKTYDEIHSLCEQETLENLWEFKKSYLKEFLVEGIDITPAFIKPVYIKCTCPEETTSCPCCFSVFYTNETVNDMTEDDDKEYKIIPDTCGHPICEPCFNKLNEDANGKCPICRQDLEEPTLPTVEEFFDYIYDKAQDGNILTQTELSLLLDMEGILEDELDECSKAEHIGYDEGFENDEDSLVILIKEVSHLN